MHVHLYEQRTYFFVHLRLRTFSAHFAVYILLFLLFRFFFALVSFFPFHFLLLSLLCLFRLNAKNRQKQDFVV